MIKIHVHPQIKCWLLHWESYTKTCFFPSTEINTPFIGYESFSPKFFICQKEVWGYAKKRERHEGLKIAKEKNETHEGSKVLKKKEIKIAHISNTIIKKRESHDQKEYQKY